MAIFKCKMCGGTLEFAEGATVGVCDSCGTKQTLPRLDDDRRANLYDRANHFRRNNEFDKAAGIYEQILSEDTTDAEAYWSLVLCQYGIEYVEDPATRKRVPTVNRAQFTSIFDDDNYKSAIQYADGYQRELYEKEAKTINDIQKGILAISQKEEPFDVFICYKETDKNGRRTPDSVLANELYHQLAQEGFKVFFARITLEDKLGSAYEPYIFAALNSAKVMVVLGTKPEHFNAVWVKNEWSRYLALVKKSGGKKVLIPAYRDMDPYDLPEEFSHLQAQDMSKLGFMQDLIRGIKKIAKVDEPKATVKESVAPGGNSASVAPLIKRVFLFLEDGEWDEADAYCEKVLDQDPENAQAYLGKLMAELRVHREEDLADCEQPFDGSNNYQKVVRFGGEKVAAALGGYLTHIVERNENARLTGIYNGAISAMSAANTESAYKAAADTFRSISGFQDADALVEQCLDKAEVCRKNAIYASAHNEQIKNSFAGCGSAIKLYESISGWKDADEQIYACQRKIEEIKAKEEADLLERERQAEQRRIAAEKAAKKRKKIAAIVTPIVVACIAFLIVLTSVFIPNVQYNAALKLYEAEQYDEAITAFEALNGYKDSAEIIKNAKYNAALKLYEAGQYDEAISSFEALNSYKDSAILRKKVLYDKVLSLVDDEKYEKAYTMINAAYPADEIEEIQYDFVESLIDYEKYNEAYEYLKINIKTEGTYEDFQKQKNYANAMLSYKKEKYILARIYFSAAKGYRDSDVKYEECIQLGNEVIYQNALAAYDEGKYDFALTLFDKDYKDGAEWIKKCEDEIKEKRYNEALTLLNNGNPLSAYQIFATLNYKDSSERANAIMEENKELFQRVLR